jgi:hypothetical protein
MLRITFILLTLSLPIAAAAASELSAESDPVALQEPLLDAGSTSACASCPPLAGNCCCGPRNYAGAELTLLQLRLGSVSIRGVEDLLDEPLRLTPDYQVEPGVRLWMGREGNNGLGWRVTGWHFDDDARLALDDVAPIEVRTELEFYSVYLELTQRGRFASWDLLGSFGAAIAGVDDVVALDNELIPLALDRDFDGGGLTLALELHRPLGNSPWELYGNFRGAFLFGKSDFDLALGTPFPTEPDNGDLDIIGSVSDQVVSIWEMRVGAERKWASDHGVVFARAGVEAQLWEMPPILLGLGDQNIGFVGPTFAIGLIR